MNDTDIVVSIMFLVVMIIDLVTTIIVYYYYKNNKNDKAAMSVPQLVRVLTGERRDRIKKGLLKVWNTFSQSKRRKLAFLIASFIAYFKSNSEGWISREGFIPGLIRLAMTAVSLVVLVSIGVVSDSFFDTLFKETLSEDLILPITIPLLGFSFYMSLLATVVYNHPERIERNYIKLIFWTISISIVLFWMHRLLEMCQNTRGYISSARRRIPAAIYLFCITCLVLTLYVLSHVPFGVYSNLSINSSQDWVPTFFRAAYYVLMTVTTAGDDGVTPIGVWGKIDHAVLVLSGVFFLTVVASMFIGSGEEEERDARRHINRAIQRIRPGRRYRTRQQNNSANGRKRYIQRRKMK